MTSRNSFPMAAAVLIASSLALRDAHAGPAESDDFAAVLRGLPSVKHSLRDGVLAASKPGAVAISAKFEDEGAGLRLSVYTAGRGLDVAAESNLLQETLGDPTTAEWKPSVETFGDGVHVARASEQLTLMRTTQLSLADVIERTDSLYGSLHGASVFSITPAIREGKGVFLVWVAAADQAFPLTLDLLTGAAVGTQPRLPRRPEPAPLVGSRLAEPVVGRGAGWLGAAPPPLAETVARRVVLVVSNSYG